MTSFVIEADGGSRGNPGPAGYGAVVKDAADGQVLVETAEAIGAQTNNVAEYRGLIAGLQSLLALAGDGAVVEVRMDSKLVIEQMAGRWKIKNEGLRPLALEAGALARRLRVTWQWIPREKNKDADRLANEAMDAAAKGRPWQPSGSAGTGSARPGSAGLGSARTGSAGTGSPLAGPSGAREFDLPGASDADAPSRPAPAPAPLPAVAAQDSLLDLIDSDAVSPGQDVPSGQGTAVPGTAGTGWRAPTTVATSLLLLRHGETPLSVERRFSGLGDPELTPNGIAQAEAAAARLSREPYGIQVVVSSPLKRARATAEIVAARLGLEVVVEEGLREADFGDWEGHTFTEIQRRWPDALAAWLADPSAAPPGGESFGVAARRVQATGDRLVERYEGRTVLAVSHVTPIKMLLQSALLAPLAALYRMHLDLAALSLIEYYADGPAVVKAFNDTSHLR
ncbi:bifunctional RNase H/acid phosphatase [Streptosporangium roseum]|uniref:Fructose-2 6-bisphosphatase-like protein n=1 Tax=Streptosporangium roseum (strain ATCC 12428 / DSM 43021 / JCM 3005 / KCTC 9067 / NCIMB 10171 / NRRL 2505 / NI 9100) TaxID=479432 RepID=D2B5L7_STRRD|nr:bifunctional RNase H/acid phosphatase [Streptosporangium roseum]ACZ89522.1 Fructose-2 6-bisphosphatase-like protein [Streptosporangium roseum DSM 43021]